MKIHYTDGYLLNPPHKITVMLIGAGGTGSQVLNCLARLNEALLALDHPGLHVRVYDQDTISEANIGRQMFSAADIGQNKAVCLVTRINRYFGNEWEAYPAMYAGNDAANIVISCVDTASARLMISDKLKEFENRHPTAYMHYWLDFGNSKKTGQVVLGTLSKVEQPKSKHKTLSRLKNVVQLLPQIKTIKEEDQGPSCSLAEAIGKQDLFINSTLAQLGMNLIWKLFREGSLTYQGCYLNLETMTVNPIKL